MRRREQVVPETDGVPTHLADGPHVPTWAHPTILAALDTIEEGHPDREGAVWDSMLSARREWRGALNEWAARAGRDVRELPIPNRRPYF